MKTSKAYYKRFKNEFTRLQQLLGLTQYRIDFFHQPLKGQNGETYYAQTEIFERDKFAKVYLTTEILHPLLDQGPGSHARHEAIHLLLHRLTWLGEGRYIDHSDIAEEAEAIVVRLEKVLK